MYLIPSKLWETTKNNNSTTVNLQTQDLSTRLISHHSYQTITSGSGILRSCGSKLRSKATRATETARETEAAVSAAVALLDATRHPELLPQQQDFPFEDAGALLVDGTPVLLAGLFRLHFPPSGSLRWSLFPSLWFSLLLLLLFYALSYHFAHEGVYRLCTINYKQGLFQDSLSKKQQ